MLGKYRKYNREYVTLKFNNGIDFRSSGLLKSFDLNIRHIENVNDLPDDAFSIDYRDVKAKLNDLRAVSENYLKLSLLN